MDDVDRAILYQLELDGRIANVDLAARVGLSASPCLRRVRALEETGIIRGYRAEIDPDALGRGFQVLVHTNMMVKDQATIEAFERQIRELPEIVECRRMFGDPDYLIWVATVDIGAYERFYMTRLTNLPGVARMNSQITMKTVKAPGHWVTPQWVAASRSDASPASSRAASGRTPSSNSALAE